MGIQAVFFDLDGTLLPMDQDEFTRGYFKLLAAKVAPHGYEPKQLIDAIWAGTAAMVENDGSRRNEEVFWGEFAKIYGEEALADKPLFDEFYANEFENAKQLCPCNPKAAEAVLLLKGMGFRLVLATNPLFPAVGTEARIRWAGLSPKDFELYTTYENSRYCKPNLDYYWEILENKEYFDYTSYYHRPKLLWKGNIINGVPEGALKTDASFDMQKAENASDKAIVSDKTLRIADKLISYDYYRKKETLDKKGQEELLEQRRAEIKSIQYKKGDIEAIETEMLQILKMIG